MFGGLVVFGGLLTFFALLAVNQFDVLATQKALENAQNSSTGTLLMMQAFAALGGLIMTPLLYLKFAEHISVRGAFSWKPTTWSILGLTALITFALIIVNSAVIEWNMSIKMPEFLAGFEEWALGEEEKRKVLTENLVAFQSLPMSLLTLLVIAVLPALGEELLFRGLLQNYFYKITINTHWAIWISAIIFGAIHVQFYGMFPRILLGALFGYLYFWSGNLWVPILAHFFNNAFSLVMYQLYQEKVIDINVDEAEAAPWYMVAFMVIVLILSMSYFKRLNESEQSIEV